MPRYHFLVCDGDCIQDEDGVILPDNQTARELQKGDEESWDRYTMEVMREGQLLWRIPFEVSDPPR